MSPRVSDEIAEISGTTDTAEIDGQDREIACGH